MHKLFSPGNQIWVYIWSPSFCHFVFNPAEGYRPDAVGHFDVLLSVHLQSQFELAVEASLGEDAIQEGDEEPLVELVVDAAAVDGLGHEGLEGGPGDLIWSDVLTTLRVRIKTEQVKPSLSLSCEVLSAVNRRRVIAANLGGVVQPGVNRVTSRAEVGLSELVFLGPAERRVPQALLDDRMEPGQQEVEASSLVGGLQRKDD